MDGDSSNIQPLTHPLLSHLLSTPFCSLLISSPPHTSISASFQYSYLLIFHPSTSLIPPNFQIPIFQSPSHLSSFSKLHPSNPSHLSILISLSLLLLKVPSLNPRLFVSLISQSPISQSLPSYLSYFSHSHLSTPNFIRLLFLKFLSLQFLELLSLNPQPPTSPTSRASLSFNLQLPLHLSHFSNPISYPSFPPPSALIF